MGLIVQLKIITHYRKDLFCKEHFNVQTQFLLNSIQNKLFQYIWIVNFFEVIKIFAFLTAKHKCHPYEFQINVTSYTTLLYSFSKKTFRSLKPVDISLILRIKKISKANKNRKKESLMSSSIAFIHFSNFSINIYYLLDHISLCRVVRIGDALPS